ncbi:MAG: hypothetical protein V1659_01450 [Candidatus Woesearchaeota archaeon]
MDIEEIKEILKAHSKVAFGPKEYSESKSGSNLGLRYITVDTKEKTIMFTSDTMDYKMSRKLEQCMEQLFSRFGITDYKVQIHIHKRDWHDKDIVLQLKDIEGIQDSEEMPEIIKFIQDKFYKVKEWDFEVLK